MRLKSMLKSVVLSVMTLALLLLGLIGLVVPVIPGVLFLFAAALCAGMAWFDRLKLAFWLGADTLVDGLPGTRRRR